MKILRRIMLTRNITAKQNKEIEKITMDIRDIQKLINQSSTTLQRADAVAEELIFKVHLISCLLLLRPNFYILGCIR
jgi:hypothetical protein